MAEFGNPSKPRFLVGRRSLSGFTVRFRRAALFLGLCLRLQALDPQLPVTEYSLRSWSRRNGYPLTGVDSLAETNDGFLWLGTEKGLFKFDGISLNTVRLTNGAAPIDGWIRALRPSHKGGLWIGTASGVSRLDQSRLTTFTSQDGLPPGSVMALLEDHNGVLWVATTGAAKSGLASITGSTIRIYDGLPNSNVLSLFEDHSGA